jgi:hypothetical protein
LLTVVMSWLLFAFLWVAQRITNGVWPGSIKITVCLSIAGAATVFLVGWGRPSLRTNPIPHGHRVGVTGWQVVWATFTVIVFGALFAWLAAGPPNVLELP